MKGSPFLALLLGVGVLAGLAGPGSSQTRREDRFVRIVLRGADFDSIDPALSYSVGSGALLDTTCARLLMYPDKPPPAGFRLEPEVAVAFPRRSADGKTYTFTLRRGFRFSDGKPVRASAFARAIERTLAPRVKSPWAAYTSEIVGAHAVLAGKASTASGVVARNYTLVVRLKHSVPDFPAQTTSLCAVPPALPADPEGIGAFPAAGPYYVADYKPGERITIRRNPFYRGSRPHHVDGFAVDLGATSHEEILDRIERGDADWGWALPSVYLDPARRLVAKYAVNRSQFFVEPGLTFRGFVFNTSRPLFRDNTKLRQAVNFAIDRSALSRAGGGPLESVPTDQYLPSSLPGFRDARIYPLDHPDLLRARALARGNLRGGKAVLYTVDSAVMLSLAQSIKQSLAKIGLDLLVKGIPLPAYFGRLGASGPYDIGFAPWAPDYLDPYAYLNVRLDGRFIGAANWARFNSPRYNRLLRQVALLQGAARYRAYGALDVQLARDAAPMLAVAFLNEPTFVSKRLGCLVLTPWLRLTSVCLK